MNRFWSNTIRNISPYIPGEQPRDKKYIKLNTNENPYPPSQRVLDAIRLEVTGDVRLYPDPEAVGLKTALAGFYGLRAEEVFVGNGSDEVLAFCFPAFFNPGDTISFPEITYSFFPVYAELFGVKCKTAPLNDDFSVSAENFPPDAGIILANPNAPTGMAIGLDQVEILLNRFSQSLVIVDEAYIDFGAQSAVPLINKYENLLVVQTFSKSRCMAGLRVGYAMGNPGLVEGLERVKNSFNSYTLDRIAQKAAAAAVEDREYFTETCQRIINTRENTAVGLMELGFKVLPSKSNFLFAAHEKIPGEALLFKLREAGILVRHFKKPEIENWLRISIGTEEEMEIFIEKLKDIMI